MGFSNFNANVHMTHEVRQALAKIKGAFNGLAKNNYSATANPAVTDDEGDGYSIGSIWINITDQRVYILEDATEGAANWILLAPIGGSGPADAKYIVQEAHADLSAEQSLGLLTTGLLKNTVTAAVGVLSTAVADSDYTANAFKTISCSSGTNPVADSAADTLTLTAGTGITVTGDSSTDTVTIAATGAANSFVTIDCPAGTDPVADSATDTLVLASGTTALTITGDSSTDTVTFDLLPGTDGLGDVIGPASSTDNAIARYNNPAGTTPKTIQDSAVTIDDDGNVTIPGSYNLYLRGTAVGLRSQGVNTLSVFAQDVITYTGDLQIFSEQTGNEMLLLGTVASAVNEVTITNAVTTAGPSIASTGDDTNIDLLLVAKGTGVVKADGVEVVTISGTQTLTNKTFALGSNTLTGSSAELATAISDETGSGALVFATSPSLTTPQISAIELGHASDTTIARVSAGVVSIEGTNIIKGTTGSTDNAILRADGTGAVTAKGSPVTMDDDGFITGAQFLDSTFRIADNVEPTRTLAFQLSGITIGFERSLTVPDESGTICLLAATQTLTNKTMSGASNTFSNIDHGTSLTGLTDDDHTQYALLAGRSGGQTLIGGTNASNGLALQSTSNATRSSVQSIDPFIIGEGAGGIDYTLTFNGDTNDGVITWMEDEDYFAFSDGVLFNTAEELYFRATTQRIYSPSAGQLDIDASTLRLNPNNAGDIILGDSTLRDIYPQTHVKIDLGKSSNAFNDAHLYGQVVLGPQSELTIATGAITATKSYHSVDTEADAASDDLDTINGGVEGAILVIRANSSARTVVAKDATGNLQLEGDCTLDNAQDTLTLIYDGTNWLETARSNNGA